jgi:glutamate racemase
MRLAFFDSGVGGLSLLCAVYRLLPDADYIYYADTLNAPLGNKNRREITSVLNKAADFLLRFEPDAVVLACNTATGCGIKNLRANGRVGAASGSGGTGSESNGGGDGDNGGGKDGECIGNGGGKYGKGGDGVKFFGVEPAVKPACKNTAKGNILVLATSATFKQSNFKRLLKKYDGGNILPCPCKNLARIVEENILKVTDDAGTGESEGYAGVSSANGESNTGARGGVTAGKIEAELRWILSGYLDKNIKAVVLGCTHYVLIKNLIQGYFPSAAIFDGNEGTAKNIAKSLTAPQNKTAATDGTPDTAAGSIKIFTSANDERTTAKYEQILKNLLNN